jgi:hypothetical protein
MKGEHIGSPLPGVDIAGVGASKPFPVLFGVSIIEHGSIPALYSR